MLLTNLLCEPRASERSCLPGVDFTIGRNITNRWTREEPAGLLSTTCPQPSCSPPRQLRRSASSHSSTRDWSGYICDHQVVVTHLKSKSLPNRNSIRRLGRKPTIGS